MPQHVPVVWNNATRVHQHNRLCCSLHKQADLFQTSSNITIDHARHIIFGSGWVGKHNITMKEVSVWKYSFNCSLTDCKVWAQRFILLFLFIKLNMSGSEQAPHTLLFLCPLHCALPHTFIFLHFVLDSCFRWWLTILIHKIMTCNPTLCSLTRS